MYYEPGRTPHNLPHDPFKSCVVPRPIGWISTVDSTGQHNLAPFSQFQNVNFDPPIVLFCANQKTTGTRKDSVANAEATGEFVWNMATYALREAVNLTAQELPPEIDEFELAKLTKLPSTLVRPVRVAESPIHFECRYLQTVRLPGKGAIGTADVVFGQVIAIHIADHALREDGCIDILKLRPIARLGYYDYTSIESVFSMRIPGGEAMNAGLEGSAEKYQAAIVSRTKG
ncbi:MAG: flavin reductase family protein [Candidatus Binataceae bacterium]|nr:flavin reductase family protein [Candidatus Binataceae bacterium]